MVQAQREVIRFLLGHLLGGLIGAVVFGIAILWLDFAGLWSLIRHSGDGIVVIFLLFFGLFITFGSVAMAIGIMSLRRAND